MKVLITGGTGFIGSNLAIACHDKGWTTTIIDREQRNWTGICDKRNICFYKNDFASNIMLEVVRDSRFDIIFHLAALPRVSYSVEHPAETNDENVQKTVQLLEVAKGNVGRFIFASSCAVYGNTDILPTDETVPCSPQSPYALQKIHCENYLKIFHDMFRMRTVALRYFNVYGPNQQGDSPYATAIASWLHAIKNGQPMRKDGTGEQSRDMVYVGDVVEANILAATAGKNFCGDIYNIGSGTSISNNEILAMLKEKFPDHPVTNAPFRLGDIMRTQANITKAQSELGYEPKTSFEDGLKLTLEWWKL